MPLRKLASGPSDDSSSPSRPPAPASSLLPSTTNTRDYALNNAPTINVQPPLSPSNTRDAPHQTAPVTPARTRRLVPDLLRPSLASRGREPSISIRKVPSLQKIPDRGSSLQRPPTVQSRPQQAAQQFGQTSYPQQPPGGYQLGRASQPRYQQPYIPTAAPLPIPKRLKKADNDDGRRRSSSEPQRPTFAEPEPALTKSTTATSYMPPLAEETSSPCATLAPKPSPGTDVEASLPEAGQTAGRQTFFQRAARNPFRRQHRADAVPLDQDDSAAAALAQVYGSNVVDMLDVIDPEVATLSTLTNVQNSLFVPDLGRYLNRRPTYNLTRPPTTIESSSDEDEALMPPPTAEEKAEDDAEADIAETRATLRPNLDRFATQATIKSTLSESRFAVLPHGTSLDGWSKEEKKELNDHVRHMLHSKREGFKRSMKGFWQYVQRPLGFLITLYATLITLFGLAWVLFLIGWVNVGGRQLYIINVIDNVLVALFAIMGDGLAPFRAVDTYHMIYIAHYHRLTWRLRNQNALPKLEDHNDLPNDVPEPREEDVGMSTAEIAMTEKQEASELSVLSPKQQQKLEHHQTKFAKSHTFYKPHETQTHHAFPLKLLIAVVVLLDCHSCLQIALGATTWGIYYKVRPFALTTVILCCSITCNITAGLLISIGDRRTRKKDVVERMFRQDLTSEAIEKMARRKEKARRREEELESFQRVEAERSKNEELYRESDEDDRGGEGVKQSSTGRSRSSLDAFRSKSRSKPSSGENSRSPSTGPYGMAEKKPAL